MHDAKRSNVEYTLASKSQYLDLHPISSIINDMTLMQLISPLNLDSTVT